MASIQPRGPRQLLAAMQWSWQGLKAAFRHEASFRLEVYCVAILTVLALWLGQTGTERILLIGPLWLVLIVELLNSAVEAVVDLVSPEWHELAGRAKDIGSAAVFVTLLLVLITWLLVLLG